MVQIQNKPVEVNVASTLDGADRVTVRLGEGANAVEMTLTPSQARLLATELIAAVNRAEVKASLKVGDNLWRRNGETRSGYAAAA